MTRLVAIVAAALALAGCASGRIDTGYPFPVEAAAPVSKAGGAPLRQMQVALADLIYSRLVNDGVKIKSSERGLGTRDVYIGRSQYTRTGFETADDESRAAATSRDMDARLDQLVAAVRSARDPKAVRNDVAAAWMAASTANCSVYVQALRSGQVSSRLLSDFFSGGLAGAATLTTPLRSARILSALSAFSTAEGASVDRNIFAQQGAELVADAILQLRQQSRARIEAKMRDQTYDNWPMGLAMTDLFEFQNDCSMLRGFAQMRDALLVREQLVAATREAAAGVARAGGTPDQMMAVLAALQVGHGAPPPPDPAASWNKDLLKQKAAALQCFEAIEVDLKGMSLQTAADVTAKFDDKFAAGKACPVDANAWTDRLNIQAKTAMKDLVPKLTEIDKSFQDLKAKGTATPAELKAAEETRAEAMAEQFKIAKNNFETSATVTINNNAGARAAVMGQLANIKGGTAKQVLDLVTATRDTGYVGDRVLEAAIANAKAINDEKPPGDAQRAAKQALGAAKGALDV